MTEKEKSLMLSDVVVSIKMRKYEKDGFNQEIMWVTPYYNKSSVAIHDSDIQKLTDFLKVWEIEKNG